MSVTTNLDIDFKPTQIRQKLGRIQGIAAIVFSLFLAMHLGTFLLAPLGFETFNSVQRFTRTAYQYPLIEILLIALPILTHSICGVWLMLIRRRETGKLKYSWHSIAGLFLLFVIGGHVLALRGPSLFYGVYPEFEGLSFSLWYLPSIFYPYYFLLAVAGFYHMTTGLSRLRNQLSLPLPRKLPGLVLIVFSIWTVISLLALGGQLFDVPTQSESAFAKLGETLLGLDISKPW